MVNVQRQDGVMKRYKMERETQEITVQDASRRQLTTFVGVYTNE